MIGKPYSGKPNVRFDEGELEIEPFGYYASSLLYCNSDKAHFSQIIKSKVRMKRMNHLFQPPATDSQKQGRVALGDGVPGCAL